MRLAAWGPRSSVLVLQMIHRRVMHIHDLPPSAVASQNKEKVNNLVLFDKVTYDKLLAEVCTVLRGDCSCSH